MPVVLGEYEINQLAAKLAKMRFNRAKWHVRNLDKKGRLDLFRVVVGTDEWHTRFTLPTLNLQITLVEKRQVTGVDKMGRERTKFQYVEARVKPIPAHLLPKPVVEEEFILA